jgi:hypothetical protein
MFTYGPGTGMVVPSILVAMPAKYSSASIAVTASIARESRIGEERQDSNVEGETQRRVGFLRRAVESAEEAQRDTDQVAETGCAVTFPQPKHSFVTIFLLITPQSRTQRNGPLRTRRPDYSAAVGKAKFGGVGPLVGVGPRPRSMEGRATRRIRAPKHARTDANFFTPSG